MFKQQFFSSSGVRHLCQGDQRNYYREVASLSLSEIPLQAQEQDGGCNDALS